MVARLRRNQTSQSVANALLFNLVGWRVKAKTLRRREKHFINTHLYMCVWRYIY